MQDLTLHLDKDNAETKWYCDQVLNSKGKEKTRDRAFSFKLTMNTIFDMLFLHTRMAMNRVHVVALGTTFILRLNKTGGAVGRTDSRLDGWSVGRTSDLQRQCVYTLDTSLRCICLVCFSGWKQGARSSNAMLLLG